MSYYTVVATDTKTGHTKTHTGVRAISMTAAIDKVAVGGDKHMSYQSWMSKYRKHENRDALVKQAKRSFWAVLARRGRKSHRRLRSNRTEFLRAWQLGVDYWTHEVDQVTGEATHG